MKLTLENGTTISNVPATARELSYSAFLDFGSAQARYSTKIDPDEDLDTDEIPELSFEEMIIEAVGYVVDVEGDFPFTLDDEPLDKWDDIPATLDNVSWVRLFKYLNWVVKSYGLELEEKGFDPIRFKVEYKGEKYQLMAGQVDRMISKRTLTAGEAIEVREIERLTNDRLKSDFFANLMFERELRILAILMRKPKEKLPFNPRKRAKFVEERARHFMEIDTATVMDVRFFLNSSIWNLLTSHLAARISENSQNLNPTDEAPTKKKRTKQKAE